MIIEIERSLDDIFKEVEDNIEFEFDCIYGTKKIESTEFEKDFSWIN